MEGLKERIRTEGQNLGNGILKVDSFINHQVDPALMLAVGGALAAHFGVNGQVRMHKTCVDRRLQWSQAKNIWHNAALRTAIYAPVHLIKKQFASSR